MEAANGRLSALLLPFPPRGTLSLSRSARPEPAAAPTPALRPRTPRAAAARASPQPHAEARPGPGGADARAPDPTVLPAPRRAGGGAQTPSPGFRPPTHPRKAGARQTGDKRKASPLWVRRWELPLPPGEVQPLVAHPTSNPPTQPFKPRSAPQLPSPPPGFLDNPAKLAGSRGEAWGWGVKEDPVEPAWCSKLGRREKDPE